MERLAKGSVVRTTVPGRLDALVWSRWHRRVILALGITWVLDGLEASLVANLGPTLRDPETLGLGAAEVGLASSVYLVGQVVGALFFGHLTDRAGRKRLFLVTLGLYLAATAASGLAPGFGSFLVLRCLAGMGIGGEYAAINSAIDELVPARLRGQIDLGINGSYWIGVALGAGVSLLLLDPALVPKAIGWRLVFLLGAVLGLGILFVRRSVPESPRWLLLHGHVAAAEQTMSAIEAQVGGPAGSPAASVEVTVSGSVGVGELGRVLFLEHPRRAVLGISLMLAQTFFYNAIFFSYGLILERFHGVRADDVGTYVVPFAFGNFLGPVLLGPLFDRWGRRRMIVATYTVSGLGLLATGGLFLAGMLDARTQTLAWCVTFFFASAAASSAYLTVSELFPVRIRGLAIAVFYAAGTSAGAFAPAIFGRIVEHGDAQSLFYGYALASGWMLVAAVVARLFGVHSEGRSLEELSG